MRRTNIGYRTMIDSSGHKYSIELLGEINTLLSERKIQLVLDSLSDEFRNLANNYRLLTNPHIYENSAIVDNYGYSDGAYNIAMFLLKDCIPTWRKKEGI